MDGDVNTQYTLSAGKSIQYYLDDSVISTVQYLSADTSTSGIQVKVCNETTVRSGGGGRQPRGNCTNCEASALISSDGWKQAKCNLDGEYVRLDSSAKTYLQEVEIIATSKIGLKLLGVNSSSASSNWANSAGRVKASNTVQRIYDGRWKPNNKFQCWQNNNNNQKDQWASYVLQGTAIVHMVKFLNRLDCCSERLADTEVWVCDNGNCEKCGQTPASTSFEAITLKAFETVTCSKPLKGDTLEVRKSNGKVQYCEISIYGECESNDCQVEPHASLKSITSVSDALCTNILEAGGTNLTSATVEFEGKSTDAEWTFNEISLKFNGADYKVTDNSETTFSDANPSKSFNFFSNSYYN